MQTRKKITESLWLAMIMSLVVAVFLLDIFLPLGVAGGVPYVLPIALLYNLRRPSWVLWLGLLCGLLTITGLLLSAESDELWKAYVNRGYALLAIFLLTIHVWRSSKAALLQQEKIAERTEALAEKVAELGRVNTALTKSNTDLQRFAYVASHDLQSPLRSIVGFLSLLKKRYGAEFDERGTDWLDRAVSGGERMGQQIRDLLTYSRVETQSHPYEQLDLNEVVMGLLNELQATIESAAAEVSVECLPEVVGDKEQLTVLMRHLLVNALMYRCEDKPTVSVSAVRRDDGWAINVADNGIGIEDKYQEQIFEIFKRLHSRQEYPGTGIGLALSRRIALRHGGTLTLESTHGVGSTFTLFLPPLEPGAQRFEQALAAPEAALK